MTCKAARPYIQSILSNSSAPGSSKPAELAPPTECVIHSATTNFRQMTTALSSRLEPGGRSVVWLSMLAEAGQQLQQLQPRGSMAGARTTGDNLTPDSLLQASIALQTCNQVTLNVDPDGDCFTDPWCLFLLWKATSLKAHPKFSLLLSAEHTNVDAVCARIKALDIQRCVVTSNSLRPSPAYQAMLAELKVYGGAAAVKGSAMGAITHCLASIGEALSRPGRGQALEGQAAELHMLARLLNAGSKPELADPLIALATQVLLLLLLLTHPYIRCPPSGQEN